jgi:hypothetical protein
VDKLMRCAVGICIAVHGHSVVLIFLWQHRFPSDAQSVCRPCVRHIAEPRVALHASELVEPRLCSAVVHHVHPRRVGPSGICGQHE